ncbi:catabolite control protein A [Peptococcaceae bacterium CEB3]|nr:catabolite control protein A [Peptococcaceae bacterium CEB3]
MSLKQDSEKGLPTIKDVAEAANVSLKTVSRVINKNENVRPETRDRVLFAAKALGYQPNAIARSLRMKKTYTIGVLIADITNSFYSAMVRGIEEVAVARDYSVIIADTNELLKKEKRYAKIFAEKQVEGLIVVPAPGSQKYLESLMERFPIVFLDRCGEGIKTSVVKVENERGAYELTKHLLEHGYREVAYVGDSEGLSTARERFAGFAKALKEEGVNLSPELVKTGNKTAQDAYSATRGLLRCLPRPQAVFAGNNLMVQGALRALNHAGLEVPRDIALVGFDDFEMADTLRPRLTVVSQPAYEMGRQAANILFGQVENVSREAKEVVFPVELIIRESCGCLGGGLNAHS